MSPKFSLLTNLNLNLNPASPKCFSVSGNFWEQQTHEMGYLMAGKENTPLFVYDGIAIQRPLQAS